jgi:hypothetical protein
MTEDDNRPATLHNRPRLWLCLGILAEAGVIDLKALPVPKGGIANEPISGDQLGVDGE